MEISPDLWLQQRNGPHKKCFYIFAAGSGLVAQWIEQQPSKLRVIGSNPIGVTDFILRFIISANYQVVSGFFIPSTTLFFQLL
jgi:hypothetical protein